MNVRYLCVCNSVRKDEPTQPTATTTTIKSQPKHRLTMVKCKTKLFVKLALTLTFSLMSFVRLTFVVIDQWSVSIALAECSSCYRKPYFLLLQTLLSCRCQYSLFSCIRKWLWLCKGFGIGTFVFTLQTSKFNEWNNNNNNKTTEHLNSMSLMIFFVESSLLFFFFLSVCVCWLQPNKLGKFQLTTGWHFNEYAFNNPDLFVTKKKVSNSNSYSRLKILIADYTVVFFLSLSLLRLNRNGNCVDLWLNDMNNQKMTSDNYETKAKSFSTLLFSTVWNGIFPKLI